MDTANRELLSIMRAAARAGVSRRTIYNWMDSGKVVFIRTATGSPRIYADTLFRPATYQKRAVSAQDNRGNHG